MSAPSTPQPHQAATARHALRPRLAYLLRVVVVLAAAVGIAGPVGAQSRFGAGFGTAGPKSVGVIAAQVTDVPQVVTLSGRAVAYQEAAIRPRIGGVIEDITFKAGQYLDAGTPMFRLEVGNLDVALTAAEAALTGAKAARQSAQATVDRYTKLEGKGVSRADLEAAEVALQRAEADLGRAEADLQAAQLERERTVIAAPISGVASRTSATIGSLVTANQTEALATVTRLDPIYVDAVASSAGILDARRRIADGTMTPQTPPEITLLLEDGQHYAAEGEIVDSGNTVSTTTGTVDLRMQFPNPDRLLLPGQFVRVDMRLGTIRAILVPQRATNRLADGSLSVFVAKDGKAARVMLTTAGVWNNAWVVTAGLSAGDEIIIDGLSNLQDGAAIETVPVALDDRGVVVDLPTASASALAPGVRRAGIARAEAADASGASAAGTGAAGIGASGANASGATRGHDRTAGSPGASAWSQAGLQAQAGTQDQAGRQDQAPNRVANPAPGATRPEGWFARLRPWLGLGPNESIEQAAERRWQRLRQLVGIAPRAAS